MSRASGSTVPVAIASATRLLHGDERVVGLSGPAPVNVRTRSVGDGLQLTLGVGTAQLVFDVDVAVVGCPRVVHRHATEAVEDAGRVEALAAALRVAGRATPTLHDLARRVWG